MKMIKSILSLMIFVVLSIAILGCGLLRKPAVVKTVPNTHLSEKDTTLSSGQESPDFASLLSKKPLILANGIEISVHVLAAMNVGDIKSFSVYTDDDAIKTYGTRGNNGVIDIKSNLKKRELKKRVKEDYKKRNVKR